MNVGRSEKRILLLGNGLVSMPVIDYFEKSSMKSSMESKIKMTVVGLTSTLVPFASSAMRASQSLESDSKSSGFSLSYMQCDLMNNNDLLKNLVSSHDIIIR